MATSQWKIFVGFIVILLVFLFVGGIISGFTISNAFKNIPWWIWIIVGLFLINFVGGKRK